MEAISKNIFLLNFDGIENPLYVLTPKLYILDTEKDFVSVCDENQMKLINRYIGVNTTNIFSKAVRDELGDYYFIFSLMHAKNSEELGETLYDDIYIGGDTPQEFSYQDLKVAMNDEQKKKYMEYL